MVSSWSFFGDKKKNTALGPLCRLPDWRNLRIYVPISIPKNFQNARCDRFERVHLKGMEHFVKNEYYPYLNIDSDVVKEDIPFLYRMYGECRSIFYSQF